MKARHLLFAAAFWILVFLMSCAHVAAVADECKGTVTPELLEQVANAAARSDYTSALIDGIPVASCLVIAAAKELYTALATDPTVKAQPSSRALQAVVDQAADPTVVKSHLADFLAHQK